MIYIIFRVSSSDNTYGHILFVKKHAWKGERKNPNWFENLNKSNRWGNKTMSKRRVRLGSSGTGSSGGRCSSVDGWGSLVSGGCSSLGERCYSANGGFC